MPFNLFELPQPFNMIWLTDGNEMRTVFEFSRQHLPGLEVIIGKKIVLSDVGGKPMTFEVLSVRTCTRTETAIITTKQLMTTQTEPTDEELLRYPLDLVIKGWRFVELMTPIAGSAETELMMRARCPCNDREECYIRRNIHFMMLHDARTNGDVLQQLRINMLRQMHTIIEAHATS